MARLERRAAELRNAPLPLLDPTTVGRHRIASAAPPEHYESAVARAVERIRAGDLEKVVLAREVQVHAAAPYDAAALHGVLREAFADCYVFCAGARESAFLAASPELLVRREGMRATTVALAGSTRRSADPAVDAHLGEQLMARRRTAPSRPSSPAASWPRCARTRCGSRRRPSPRWCAWPTSSIWARRSAPSWPRRARPSSSPGCCTRRRRWAASRCTARARSSPRSRAWTAAGTRGRWGGPTRRDDGEFCVALRCALLSGSVARCYAGVGVVRDSDPASELAETETKLQALLPVLT